MCYGNWDQADGTYLRDRNIIVFQHNLIETTRSSKLNVIPHSLVVAVDYKRSVRDIIGTAIENDQQYLALAGNDGVFKKVLTLPKDLELTYVPPVMGDEIYYSVRRNVSSRSYLILGSSPKGNFIVPFSQSWEAINALAYSHWTNCLIVSIGPEVSCIDPKSGDRKWSITRPLGNERDCQLMIENGFVYFLYSRDGIYRYSSNEEVMDGLLIDILPSRQQQIVTTQSHIVAFDVSGISQRIVAVDKKNMQDGQLLEYKLVFKNGQLQDLKYCSNALSFPNSNSFFMVCLDSDNVYQALRFDINTTITLGYQINLNNLMGSSPAVCSLQISSYSSYPQQFSIVCDNGILIFSRIGFVASRRDVSISPNTQTFSISTEMRGANWMLLFNSQNGVIGSQYVKA